MFKFLNKNFSSIAFALLATTILLATATTSCMENNNNNNVAKTHNSFGFLSPYAKLYGKILSYFVSDDSQEAAPELDIEKVFESIKPQAQSDFESVKNVAKKVPGFLGFGKVLTLKQERSTIISRQVGPVLEEVSDSLIKPLTKPVNGVVKTINDRVEQGLKAVDDRAEQTLKALNDRVDQSLKIVNDRTDGVMKLVNDSTTKVLDMVDKKTKGFDHISEYFKAPIKVGEYAKASFDYVANNKLKVAGITIGAVVVSIAIPKLTILACDKIRDIVMSKDKAPKSVDLSGYVAAINTRKELSRIERMKAFVFGNFAQDSIFLNLDCAEAIANFALIEKITSDAISKGQAGISYKNIVMTGDENFVKGKVCESIAKNASKNIILIDKNSSLFDTTLDEAQRKNIVSKFFDKLNNQKNSSLIFVNLDSLNGDEFKNLNLKLILRDILEYSKQRSGKYNFVFACPSLEGYSELLSNSYDNVVNLSRPDKNAREQIVMDLVNKLILHDLNDSSSLTKLGIYLGVITTEKQQAFKEYFTDSKLDFVVESLNGKSYQEIQNFVMQLRAFISQKTVGVIKNYDVFINILLNKASNELSGKLSKLNLNPEKYWEVINR